MAQTASNAPAKYGSIGASRFINVPDIWVIWAEWMSIIPLACHLASYQHDSRLVGEAALMGRMSVSLFPRLGVTGGIARFLGEGSDFIDRTSTQGQRVWDVKWGSHFPASNGSASVVIAKQALKNRGTRGANWNGVVGQSIQRWMWGPPRRGWIATSKSIEEDQYRKAASHRRYQTLHVLQFGRSQVKRTWRVGWHALLCSRPFQMLSVFTLLLASAFLIFFEMYGTAAAVIVGAGSRLACQFLGLERPSRYLANNEQHDACMLTAQNENSSNWYLYTGDRSVVDGLLNKHLILPPEGRTGLKAWFGIAHALQLLAMTFVAAQKGWDGPAMMVLIALNWILEWQWNDTQVAETWLAAEGVTVDAKSFCFTGRTQMCFSIHLLSGSNSTTWMDSILTPHRRLRVLERRLKSLPEKMRPVSPKEKQELDSFDQTWVHLHEGLAREGANVLKSELNKGRQQP